MRSSDGQSILEILKHVLMSADIYLLPIVCISKVYRLSMLVKRLERRDGAPDKIDLGLHALGCFALPRWRSVPKNTILAFLSNTFGVLHLVSVRSRNKKGHLTAAFCYFSNGAPDKIRTCDPYHVKVIL